MMGKRCEGSGQLVGIEHLGNDWNSVQRAATLTRLQLLVQLLSTCLQLLFGREGENGSQFQAVFVFVVDLQ